jgi:hypothetical protein
MTEFRLTQISDTHLSRSPRFAKLTENFHRVSEHINAARPDLVINSGDVACDSPTSRDDLEYAEGLHAAMPVEYRYLPGNHDIGDNPTAVGKPPAHPANEKDRAVFIDVFAEDPFSSRPPARFIGLNSLIMNTGIPSEIEQMDWLTSRLSGGNGKPIALFTRRCSANAGGSETRAPRSATCRSRCNKAREMLGSHDVRLVASGHVHQRRDCTVCTRHVWAPSTGFIMPSGSNHDGTRKPGSWNIASDPTVSRSSTFRARSGHCPHGRLFPPKG